MKRSFVKFETAALLALVIIFVSALAGSMTCFARECSEIRGGTLRLHVIANSDSDEDQRMKLLVRDELLDIPYGSTTAYGDIAARIAKRTGRRQSARAVGGAVGRDPLGVIVPCHRVVGADGSLTGFGGGMPAKVALLRHEGVRFA